VLINENKGGKDLKFGYTNTILTAIIWRYATQAAVPKFAFPPLKRKKFPCLCTTCITL